MFGKLAGLKPEAREALHAAIEARHAQPPNLGGPNQWTPAKDNGKARHTNVRRFVLKNYLEEAIYQYHVQQQIPVTQLCEPTNDCYLGYSYSHLSKTWKRMVDRALATENNGEQDQGIRDFVLMNLEDAVRIGRANLEVNAAYGAVLIRACEAIKDICGLESENTKALSIEDLAKEARGRSPLLLQTMEHSDKFRAKAALHDLDDDVNLFTE
jgi:hypothetical protein